MHAWCALVFVGCLLAAANASFVNPYKEEKYPAVKADVKYVKCQLCSLIVKQARRAVKQSRQDQGPKFEEADILDMLEKMCDPDAKEGTWITHHDMVEKGDKIDVVDVGMPGECTTECRTMARACNEVMEDADITELSEALYHNKQNRAQMEQLLCRELTPACTKKPPPVPKTRQPGEEHSPITAEKLQMKQMMQSMKASGMGGQMYNTEDLLQQMKDTPPQEGEVSDDEFLEKYEKAKAEGIKLRQAGGGGNVQKLLGQGAAYVQKGVGKAASMLGRWKDRAAAAVAGMGEEADAKAEL